MVEFHATGYGSRFYNGQLPALIHALERIAVSLEKLSSKPVLEEEKVHHALVGYLQSVHGLTLDDANEDARQVTEVVFGTLTRRDDEEAKSH